MLANEAAAACFNGKQLKCAPTVMTVPADYATETRGMNTFYPTDGRIEAPDWFSSTIPNFEDIAGEQRMRN